MRYNPLMNTKILTVLTFSLLLSACTCRRVLAAANGRGACKTLGLCKRPGS